MLYRDAGPLCRQRWAGCGPRRDQLRARGSTSPCCQDSSLRRLARAKLFGEQGETGGPTGSAEVQLGVRLGGSARRRGGRAELQREEKQCRHAGAARPPSDPPKVHRWHRPPLREGWGQVWGAQHRCDGAYRPQAGGCHVRRALPTARAILPAAWKGPAAQPSSLHAPHPLSQLSQHSPPSGVSGEGLGARLVPGTRPGGEKGGGDGDGSSCEDRAKGGNSSEGVHPPAAMAQDGGAARR